MKKIVIKVSSNLVNPDNNHNIDIVEKISNESSKLIDKGHQVIIVSSGAVMHGVKSLGLTKKPDSVPMLQSCASIGQIKLMARYKSSLKKLNKIPAQILVSIEDFNNRKRYLNLRNTVNTLLSLNVIPVFNENDTINTEELKFGDNDHLSAIVTLMMEFDMLIILTDVDGIYNCDPKKDSNACLISSINYDEENQDILASSTVSEFSTGGMLTKLKSAKLSAKGGIDVFIGNGFKCSIDKIINNEEIGTFVHGNKNKTNARKKWLGFSPVSGGNIEIDHGAYIALKEKKSSLLATGIKKINGNFTQGSLVSIIYDNKKIAQGLTNYPSKDLELIKGIKSQDFDKYIKNCDYEVIIHKNNLFLIE